MMRSRFQLFGSAIVILLVLMGCERDVYRLEMRPEGERFERRITGWHERRSGEADEPPKREPLPQAVRNRLGAIYSDMTRSADGIEHTYRGEFLQGKMPQDIGGAGEYRHWTSPMGSASLYVERFRGNDDLQGQLEHRHAAANQAVDLLVGWFESLAGKHPNFTALRQFLDGPLRRDLINVSNQLWTMSAVAEASPSEEAAQSEAVFRIGQYLYERGYLDFASVPDLGFGGIASSSADSLARLQRILAEKLGAAADQPIPKELAILSNAERAERSLNDYLATTPWYAARIKEWEASGDDKDVTPPRPVDLYGELLSEALLEIDLFGSDPDHVEVVLAAPVEPFATSGTWDAAAGEVHWSADLGKDRTLPALFYARWSQPDAAFQQAHFGRVVLEGQSLAETVRWYDGLTPAQREEWDRFVASLRPGAELASRIEAFRFTGEPAPAEGQEPAPSAADLPRRLLREGLQAP